MEAPLPKVTTVPFSTEVPYPKVTRDTLPKSLRLKSQISLSSRTARWRFFMRS